MVQLPLLTNAEKEITIESIENRLSSNADDFDGIIMDMLFLLDRQAKEIAHYKLTAGY